MPPSIAKYLIICGLGIWALNPAQTAQADSFQAGFIYDDFKLTLAPGHRTEILGPVFYDELKETQRTWAIPVLTIANTEDPTTEYREFDFLYPILTPCWYRL